MVGSGSGENGRQVELRSKPLTPPCDDVFVGVTHIPANPGVRLPPHDSSPNIKPRLTAQFVSEILVDAKH